MSESSDKVSFIFSGLSLTSRQITDYYQPIELNDEELAALFVVILQPFGVFFKKTIIPINYNRTMEYGPFSILIRHDNGLNLVVSTTDSLGGFKTLILMQLCNDGIFLRIIDHFCYEDGDLRDESAHLRCGRQLCLRTLAKAEEYVRAFHPTVEWTLSRDISLAL